MNNKRTLSLAAIVVLSFVLSLLAGTIPFHSALALQLPDGAASVPNVLLASVSEEAKADDLLFLLRDSGVAVESVQPVADGVLEVRVQEGASLDEVASIVYSASYVRSVQPDFVYPAAGSDPSALEGLEPSGAQAERAEDTYANLQWNLNAVDAPGAWEAGWSGRGVSVAIIDSGFDTNHPDLADSYVGAFNVFDGSANVNGGIHGHQAAAVIAATRSNGFGTASVAPDAKVVPVAAAKDGTYTTSSLLKAFDYLLRKRAEYNIRAINMSFGLEWKSPTGGDVLLNERIDEAYADGVVVVASAGNNGSDISHCPCDYGTVVGVMGLTYAGFDPETYPTEGFDEARVVRSEHSNYNAEGSVCRSITAPGFDVPVPAFGNYSDAFDLSWGTSFSAPHVCAAVALMFQANPKLTAAQAVSALYGTARDMGDAGWDAYHGHGALDAGAASHAVAEGRWLEGPAFMAAGRKAAYIAGDGGALVSLEAQAGAVSVELEDGVGVVRAHAAGTAQLLAETEADEQLCAEVNVVGPIDGTDVLEVGQAGEFSVAQAYPFVYRWSVNGGEVIGTGDTFSFVPAASGVYEVRAALVADPSVVLSRVVRVGGGEVAGAGVRDGDALEPPHVWYSTCVVGAGWHDWARDGAMDSVSGKSEQVRAIQIALSDKPCDGGIEYSAYDAAGGWQEFVRDGVTSGDLERVEPLQGMRVRLYGELAEHFDVWYRVDVQGYGWQGWACDGTDAGMPGESACVEAVQIRILPKGGGAPGLASAT